MTASTPSTAQPSANMESPFRTAGVVTVSGAHFVHDTYTAFLAPLLPLLIENLTLTKTLAGLLTVFYQGPSLIQPLIGHLGDRVNLRLLVVTAPAVAAAMMTLLGVAPGYAGLALLLLVAGISSAGLHSIGPVMVGQFSGGSLGRGMSFWMVGGELARTLGPLIVVAAIQVLTPSGLPWLMIGGIAASIALFFRLRRVPAYIPAAGSTSTWSDAFNNVRPILVPVAGLTITRSLLFSSLTIFLPTFLTEQGADLWLAGGSLSIMEAAGVAGALSGGLISDRLGRRQIMAVMTLAAPLAVFGFLNARGWLIFPALLVVGFTMLSTTPVIMALVQERSQGSRALANGIYMALNFVVTSLAVVLVGAIADRFSMLTAFYVSAATMLAGLPFLFLLANDSKKTTDPRAVG